MRLAFFLLCGVLLLFGCTQPPVSTPTPTSIISASPTPAASISPTDSSLAGSVNQFAFDFYAQLTESEDGNIFYSPFSASQAFSILYEGAAGNTASELEAVFGFEKDAGKRRSSVSVANGRLNEPNSEYSLSLANALWIQKDFPILNSYTSVVKDYYGGDSSNLDFIGDPVSSADTINDWAFEKTNGRIPSVLVPEMITPDLRLVITNAIYFKGKWLQEFDKAKTRDMEFRVSPQEKIQVPMMYSNGEEAGFRYMDNDVLQMLELPYKGDALSMLVLLPKNDDITALESEIDASKLDDWKKELASRQVEVYLPKFKMETDYDLTAPLKKMGASDVFTPYEADLSGIDGAKDLFVSFALQKAFVEVNEEGTEAAAVTVIGIGITSVREGPPVFKADHPFLFLIQEKTTGAVLFMGRVSNPLA
ncbi:MAG: serpin family protein [Candidatus Micrarchaeota archaeon]